MIHSFFYIFFFIEIKFFTFTSQANETVHPRAPAVTQLCKLETCWKDLYPAIHDTLQDAQSVLNEYQSRYFKRMVEIDADTPVAKDEEAERSEYESRLLQSYLDECEDLSDGPTKPRHIIVVGHNFAGDGGVFSTVANSIYKQKVRELCGKKMTPREFNQCKKSIVIKSDIDKEGLNQYQKMLGPGSVQDVTYVGHGIEDALILGPKNLLLPMDYTNDLSISREEWLSLNSGVLYAEELEGDKANEWARVVKPGAPITFYACLAGNKFAPAIKKALPQSTVKASYTRMRLAWKSPDGGIVMPPDSPPPNSRPILVPERSGTFLEIKEKNHPALDPVIKKTPLLHPKDRAAQSILVRLATDAVDGPVLVDGGKKAIYFTKDEKKMLARIFTDKIAGRDLRDTRLSWSAINDRLENDKKLREKIDKCIKESVRLYYQKP